MDRPAWALALEVPELVALAEEHWRLLVRRRRAEAGAVADLLVERLQVVDGDGAIADRLIDAGCGRPSEVPHALIVAVVGPRVVAEVGQGTARGLRWWLSWHAPLISRVETRDLASGVALSPIEAALRWRALEPSNAVARRCLVVLLAESFQYALHELPSGVLSGMNGATDDDCVEYLQWLDVYEEIVTDDRLTDHWPLVDLARLHFLGWRAFLRDGLPGEPYAAFLERTDSPATRR